MTKKKSNSDHQTHVRDYYERIPYSNHPYPQTYINHLGAVGIIYGVESPNVEQCRVVELGCGRGANLLSVACQYPGSQFLGIDLSPSQVKEANQRAENMGLENIEFKAVNILELELEKESVDYFIGHGLLSWVNPEVQKRILELAQTSLSPQGLGYLSYNCYPGWHMRNKFRDIMRYHSKFLEDPLEKLDMGIQIVNSMVEDHQDEDATKIQPFLHKVSRSADYFLHDFHEPDNHAFYLYDFIELLQQHKLQYICDSDPGVMCLDAKLSPAMEAHLKRLEKNQPFAREQHLDFLNNRAFRQSVFCRAEVEVDHSRSPHRISELNIFTSLKPKSETPDLHSAGYETFYVESQDPDSASVEESPEATMKTSDPLSKATLFNLCRLSPYSIPVSELLKSAWMQLTRGQPMVETTEKIQECEERVTKMLLDLQTKHLIKFYRETPGFVLKPSERPVAYAWAREMAPEEEVLRNVVLNRNAVDSDFVRQMLPLLDGTRDREALVMELKKEVENGKLTLMQDGERITASPQVEKSLAYLVEMGLKRLAEMQFLVM